MREKIIEFTFEVSWVEGKTHYIADALSRAPVFAPEEEEFTIDCAITHFRQIKEESQIMHTFAGLQQEEYTQLIEVTLQGKEFGKLPLLHTRRELIKALHIEYPSQQLVQQIWQCSIVQE